MTTLNLADLVAAAGYVSLLEAHDEFGVTGGDSWYVWYSGAVGADGHLADLMYAYWLDPSPEPGGGPFLLVEFGDRLVAENNDRLVVE